MTLQFIAYNITLVAVIAHFFDSAKEREWTDTLYRSNYYLWLISSLMIMLVAIIGIVPVFLETDFGNYWSVVTSIGGFSGYGYHKIMHALKKSNVCLNRPSYLIMWLLNLSSGALLLLTIYNLYMNH